MLTRYIFIILIFALFNLKLFSDDTLPKIILNDKNTIIGNVKIIDEKKVVSESGVEYKKDDVQEVFFRNKTENSSSTVLLLNNDAILYINDFLILDNKVSFTFLNESIELPMGLIKGIIYKNISIENGKIWKKSLSLNVRKTDTVFVLKDEKLIPVEGLIKEIEKDKIKIFWDEKDKIISSDKVVCVLFASAMEKLIIDYEIQTIDGSKIFCNSVFINNDNICKIGISNKEEDFHLACAKISRILFNNRKSTFLSVLEPIEVVTEKILIDVNSYWEKDQSIWKKPLSLGSKTYAKGLGVHSYCLLKYKIPEGSIQFITDYGIDGEVLNNSGCIFKIMVDKKVYLDEVVKSADGAKSISIDLPSKCQEILLIVEPGPNLDIGDHGVWGNARFIKN